MGLLNTMAQTHVSHVAPRGGTRLPYVPVTLRTSAYVPAA